MPVASGSTSTTTSILIGTVPFAQQVSVSCAAEMSPKCRMRRKECMACRLVNLHPNATISAQSPSSDASFCGGPPPTALLSLSLSAKNRLPSSDPRMCSIILSPSCQTSHTPCKLANPAGVMLILSVRRSLGLVSRCTYPGSTSLEIIELMVPGETPKCLARCC